MPVAVKETVFNAERFRKCVRLFDSDRVGERDMAIRQALRLCAEHVPPLLFCEAAALAFATDGEELPAALDRIAELESEIARLETAAERLANGLTEQQEIAARLRREVERLHGEKGDRDKDAGAEKDMGEDVIEKLTASFAGLTALIQWWWPPIAWTAPNILTLVLAVDIAVAWVWANCLGYHTAPDTLQFLIWLRVGIFAAWGVSIYRTQGRTIFWIKFWLWACGWFAVVIGMTYLEWGEWTLMPHIPGAALISMIAPPLWWIPLQPISRPALVVCAALIGLITVVRLSLYDFSNSVLLFIERRKGG